MHSALHGLYGVNFGLSIDFGIIPPASSSSLANLLPSPQEHSIMTATDSADPAIPSIPWCGSGYYVEALHGQQPCGDGVLERIFVAVRWYGSPADHSEPHGPTVATARFDSC